MTPPIIHLIQRYPPALGGAESYFARLSRAAAAAGMPVQVHTTTAVSLEAFWRPGPARMPAGMSMECGVEVHRHPVRHFPGRKLVLKALSLLPHPWIQGLTMPASPLLPSIWALARHSTQPIRLVHGSAFPYTFPLFCGLTWARRMNVPFLLTPFLHLGDPTQANDRTRQAYLSPPLRYLLKQADRLFVQTELERQAVLEQGIAADKIILQGLGCDPAECTGGNRHRADERWNLPGNGVVRIGHLANLSEEKGTVDLLRAVAMLQEKRVSVEVVLAGPSMPNFHRYWRTVPASLRTHVHVLGTLKDEEKPDFYSAIDLFALPSRSDSFGLVLLEAWANGIPCVGYRAGGIAEVISHQSDGLLAPCGNVEQLADDLAILINSKSTRENYGEAGRNKVKSRYSWPEKLALVTDIYEALL
ncbi:MAG: glycosyltransferase family 4 protein [Gemmatales bacterium]